MTNREKYKKQILDIACNGNPFAIRERDRKLVGCNTLCCDECFFRSNGNSVCTTNLKHWCNSEYEEPKVDWSKVEVDTPILVSNDGKEWCRRYFSRCKDGKVFAWLDGRTSWSVYNKSANDWYFKYAKLAESEE